MIIFLFLKKISCNVTTMIKVYKSIYHLPKVLVLHINLFDKDGNKNNKKIKYDETMDLSRYITSTKDKNSIDTNYQLCGMIVHQGGSSIHSGHFVIYVKSSNGMWYCLDNEQVSLTYMHVYIYIYINKKKMVNIFILFY